jgi:hypothetical protein
MAQSAASHRIEAGSLIYATTILTGTAPNTKKEGKYTEP